MLGIRFEVPNQYGTVINKIFEEIDIKKYNWLVKYEDILINPVKEGKQLFKKNVMTGDEFCECINNTEYYVIFLGLIAFPQNSCVKSITCFADYFNSESEIMIFFTDAIYVDLYSKNNEIIDKIMRAINKNHFTSIEGIHCLGNKDSDLMPLIK